MLRRVWSDDYAICCCVSATHTGKEMQFFGARANLAKCLLYAINGGKDEKDADCVFEEDAAASFIFTLHNKSGEEHRFQSGCYIDFLHVLHFLKRAAKDSPLLKFYSVISIPLSALITLSSS